MSVDNVVDLPKGFYVYETEVEAVYDADTITMSANLGFHTRQVGEKVRLFGINAPEMRGEEKERGTISRDWLRGQVLGKKIVIETIKAPSGFDKKGKYGRYLAKLFLPLPDGKYLDVNAELVSRGLAIKADY